MIKRACRKHWAALRDCAAANVLVKGLTSIIPYSASKVFTPMTNVPERKLFDSARAADPLNGFEQYNHRNWDGYDAKPITPETLRYARHLLGVMPDTFGPPDIAPSGDGSIRPRMGAG